MTSWRGPDMAPIIRSVCSSGLSSSASPATTRCGVDTLDVAFPGQSLGEFIEFRLVGVVRHPHETLFERRRGFLEDRVASGLEAGGNNCRCGNSRFVGGQDRAEER